jgi:hypothetical protein
MKVVISTATFDAAMHEWNWFSFASFASFVVNVYCQNLHQGRVRLAPAATSGSVG